MGTLILLRHGKSDWSGGEPDHLRPLASRGRRQAPEAGRWLAEHVGPVELALVSPAERTRETWRLAAAELAVPPPVREDDRLYAAPAESLLGVVRELADRCPRSCWSATTPASRSWWQASRVAGCRCRRPRWPSSTSRARGPPRGRSRRGWGPTDVRRPGELQVDDGQDDCRDPDQGREHRRHQPGAHARKKKTGTSATDSHAEVNGRGRRGSRPTGGRWLVSRVCALITSTALRPARRGTRPG